MPDKKKPLWISKAALFYVLRFTFYVLRLFCDPAGTRTQDPSLKRAMLYQLSYRVNLIWGCKSTTLSLKFKILNSKCIIFIRNPASGIRDPASFKQSRVTKSFTDNQRHAAGTFNHG